MKQILINIIFLVCGLGIGILSVLLLKPSSTQPEKEIVYVDKLREEIIRDTVFREKKIFITPHDSLPNSDQVEMLDTLLQDSLNFIGEDDIYQDQLISQQTINVNKDTTDSTDISEVFNLQSEAFTDRIVVEFWESPLNITGYELSRNKLKLFGFNPNETVSLYFIKKENGLQLKSETIQLVLTKTKQFKTLKL